jgi:hypothetical protein
MLRFPILIADATTIPLPAQLGIAIPFIAIIIMVLIWGSKRLDESEKEKKDVYTKLIAYQELVLPLVSSTQETIKESNRLVKTLVDELAIEKAARLQAEKMNRDAR